MSGSNEDAVIVLTRASGWKRDALRGYQVVIDGEPAAKIKRGQTLRLSIAAGSHEVFMRIDWCRSPTVAVEAHPGEIIEMSCEPGGAASEGLNAVVGGARGAYIRLTLV